MTEPQSFGGASAPNIELAQHPGGIRTITINNPGRRNALTRAMCIGLAQAADAVANDPAARVVILRGAGDSAFCSGADIGEFESLRATREQADEFNALIDAAFKGVLDLEVPVIAVIHGYCVGGGMALALMCDLRFMEPSGKIGIPAGKLGIAYSPDWLKRLVDVVGEHAAKRLMFTSELFTADVAARWDFATELVDKQELDATVAEVARRSAALAPLSLRAAKAAIRASTEVRDDDRWEKAHELARLCDESDDYRRGYQAFRDRTQPVFEGK
ncbi:enoyl-CoA hydratase-related protein [Oricola sp.]|uniref:enoyl-CoA hydratase/isomerase family protein n=1 Tax=Oricola sp. TaxID=1979950 RepID=UPI0025F05B9C|nr:enoyl-CoA hydratase-related protein [Oricola sp.]MCI5074131.1 enoyl-CoA hydratase-related protein [Oricola sp.]